MLGTPCWLLWHTCCSVRAVLAWLCVSARQACTLVDLVCCRGQRLDGATAEKCYLLTGRLDGYLLGWFGQGKQDEVLCLLMFRFVEMGLLIESCPATVWWLCAQQ